jgi:hypothetical protein
MIHVSRALVRGCVEYLARLPGWQERPCRALIRLAYCLNNIADCHPFALYRSGVPRPAQTIRELKGLRGLAQTAEKSGNVTKLTARLEKLSQRDADAFHLTRFRFAREIHPSNPVAGLIRGDTTQKFLVFAVEQPHQLAAFCDDAIAALEPLKASGRGGKRRIPAPNTRYIIEELGHYYEWLTGRPPGATIDQHDDETTHKGPFLGLSRKVLTYFGHQANERWIYELLLSIEVPDWKTHRRKYPRRWGRGDK